MHAARAVLVCFLAGAVSLSALAADALQVKGTVDEVTVYRGQALVTRLVKVPGPAGLREIVVTDLPDRVLPGSIYAESADGLEIRSVRYRVRPVSQDVREEVRKLDAQIRELQDKLQAAERATQLISEHKAYLKKLEQFVAPTANVELSKGVLDAETLVALTKFLFEQRQALTQEELKLSMEQRDLKERLAVLQRERNLLTGGSARTVREAVVFVNVQRQGGGALRLRYLVDQATWWPSYNIRTDVERKGVVVEYNASIRQMSGEEWPDVVMTLSTATPSLVAKAPELAPLKIRLTAAKAPKAGVAVAQDYKAIRQQIRSRRAQAEAGRLQFAVRAGQVEAATGRRQRLEGRDELKKADAVLNELAGQEQILELLARGRVVTSARPTRAKPHEGVSVTYRLAGRTSLPSRADQQLIQIASLAMKARFYKVAQPVLTSYVYDEALVTNQSAMVLLAGPVSAFVAGEFVGHGQIPTVAAGETFTVGFGIDSSLRASRTLVSRSEKVQGGNRIVTSTYRLSVENFSAEPAAVRLMDRLPTAKESEIDVTLTSTGKELSSDPAYLQTQRKKGILRWDVEVPPQAIGPKAFTLDYEFVLEYDKQMSIAGMPAAER